jgi:signal transduction histidine kinase
MNAAAVSVDSPNTDATLRRTFGAIAIGIIVVFGGVFFGMTGVVRTRLRQEVVQREAQSIQAVAQMQISAAQARFEKLGLPLQPTDIFTAVLESSRLHGVLAVQLFDPSGTLRDALPSLPGNTPHDAWWSAELTAPDGRYHSHGTLEQVFGSIVEESAGVTPVPLLEIVVPLRADRRSASFGTARYWIEATPTQEEFHRLDLRLFGQAIVAFGFGTALVLLVLGWAYRQQRNASRQLVARSLELAQANRELDFAAKTGALGAISAHLVHGLKNPLAGLEEFVAEIAAEDSSAVPPDARATAVQTARRLRTLVNEVVSVLRDEAAGAADHVVPAQEIIEAVRQRNAANAERAGVELVGNSDPYAQVSARTASLAGLVLANLVANAIEAMPRGGQVRVVANSDTTYVRFAVSDSGPGLPSHVKASLFTPVASSKPTGGGMGLAISARLARHAGGELSVVRTDASGTEFQLAVPKAK